jgi:hypothetical protein
MTDIAKAVAMLHDAGYAHTQLMAENVYVAFTADDETRSQPRIKLSALDTAIATRSSNFGTEPMPLPDYMDRMYVSLFFQPLKL